MNTATHSGQYALATGANAVGRLDVLHSIYSSTGRIGLIEAGLKVGMTAADFGCGSGTMTRLLAAMAGPSGRVTGIDLNAPQVEQAKELCARQGLTNSDFIVADAPSHCSIVATTRARASARRRRRIGRANPGVVRS